MPHPRPRALPLAAEPHNDLQRLDDAFTRPAPTVPWERYETLEGWPGQVLRSERDFSAGILRWWVRPSVWYAPLRGPFVFRRVSGDFAVRTRVRVDAGGQFSTRLGSLAGLMLRAPQDGGRMRWRRERENYVVHAAGTASGASGDRPAIEITSTTNGRSGVETYHSVADWVELCVARLGPTIVALHRLPGEEWTSTQTAPARRWGSYGYQGSGHLIRADLPHDLQVGLMAMADWDVILGHQNLGFHNEYFERPETFNDTLKTPVLGGLQVSFAGVGFRRLHCPERWRTYNLSHDVHPSELRALVLGRWAS